MKTFKIDEVVSKVWDTHRNTLSANRGYEPKLAIYMSHDYYQECKADLHHNHVSELAHEFYSEGTIMGYTVFRVIPHYVSSSKVPPQHPPWQVVNLNS